METAYRNIGFILLALPVVIVTGFWIPYFSEFPKFDAFITVPVHVHAGLLFAWVALLVIQPLAIRRRAFKVHRFFGRASYVLTPLIVLFAAMMVRKEYLEHLADGMTAAAASKSEYLSSVQLVLFGVLYVLAIAAVLKRDAPAHMRYMICIALVLLPAGLARTLGYWFGVGQSTSQFVCLLSIDACLVLMIAFDRRRQLAAAPFVLTFAAYVLLEVGWVALGRPV